MLSKADSKHAGGDLANSQSRIDSIKHASVDSRNSFFCRKLRSTFAPVDPRFCFHCFLIQCQRRSCRFIALLFTFTVTPLDIMDTTKMSDGDLLVKWHEIEKKRNLPKLPVVDEHELQDKADLLRDFFFMNPYCVGMGAWDVYDAHQDAEDFPEDWSEDSAFSEDWPLFVCHFEIDRGVCTSRARGHCLCQHKDQKDYPHEKVERKRRVNAKRRKVEDPSHDEFGNRLERHGEMDSEVGKFGMHMDLGYCFDDCDEEAAFSDAIKEWSVATGRDGPTLAKLLSAGFFDKLERSWSSSEADGEASDSEPLSSEAEAEAQAVKDMTFGKKKDHVCEDTTEDITMCIRLDQPALRAKVFRYRGGRAVHEFKPRQCTIDENGYGLFTVRELLNALKDVEGDEPTSDGHHHAFAGLTYAKSERMWESGWDS
ncbi:unnamed protein product [Amoebophrya sp. A120]|nr:unnamed protein product [Amoebophrya sp. A120]|eukprot:GSA120T00005499001.1